MAPEVLVCPLKDDPSENKGEGAKGTVYVAEGSACAVAALISRLALGRARRVCVSQ